MTLDNHSWSEYFDSLGGGAERLNAAVTLARDPLWSARARRQGSPVAKGGLLEAIRFDSQRDEIVVSVCHDGGSGASIRYFVPAPRSVTVEDSPLGKVIAVTDAEGVRTLISVAKIDGDSDRCECTAAAAATR